MFGFKIGTLKATANLIIVYVRFVWNILHKGKIKAMATSTTVQTINNDKLLKLGERFLNDYEKQKTRSLMYYKKMKNDPVFF